MIYLEFIKALFRKFLLRQNTGTVIKKFCEKMGVVYIKLAQILATQNIGNIFTEKDRQMLSSICDNCKPIPYYKIKQMLELEYNKPLDDIFEVIQEAPLGAASISQVHKAVLKSGKVVAIKIKRKDITKNIEKDIKQIKKLMKRFGRIVKFNNFTGGDTALNLYLKWIFEETDFYHEQENIGLYTTFANSVNGALSNVKNIRIPYLYEEYCTENIIVMEYIPHKTINQLELNKDNQQKIRTALNSYLQLSFYALFHDQKIEFHGDPHGGNIYIDDDGNIGFLDMGLLFELTEEDSILIRNFFLAAYSANVEKLYEMLAPYGNFTEKEKNAFKNDVSNYCQNIRKKTIPPFFTDMINICLKYEFVPPNFLFCMSKAFMCLDGINGFSKNNIKATELLQEQTLEFFLNRSIKDCKKLAFDNLKSIQNVVKNTLTHGLAKGLSAELMTLEKNWDSICQMYEHSKEIIELIRLERKDRL